VKPVRRLKTRINRHVLKNILKKSRTYRTDRIFSKYRLIIFIIHMLEKSAALIGSELHKIEAGDQDAVSYVTLG